MGANPSNHMDVEILHDDAAVSAAGTSRAGSPSPAVARYDFKKSKRVSRDVLQSITELHTDFVREFAYSLSTLARNPVEVKLLGPEQLATRDFLARLDMPTSLSVLRVEPLPEPWMVDIQPSVLYPLIDCMLGGGHPSGPLTSRRSLTDVELRLVARISELLCNELRTAWRRAADLRISLLQVESNPRAVKTPSLDDAAIMLRFGIAIGQRRGLMRLCLPVRSIEPLRDRLSGGQSSSDERQASPETVERIGREVRSTEADIKVWLAETRITTQELLSLRVGDIIATQKNVQDPVVVAVSDVPKFHARPGAVRGHKAVVITEPLDAPPAGGSGQ